MVIAGSPCSPRALRRTICALAVLLPLAAWNITGPAAGAATSGGTGSASAGSYVLTATSTGGNYAPTFTGNGYIGVRVPPAGQGYAAGSVATDSTLAGFYAQAPGQVQQRANLPAWSGLAFGDGGQDFSLSDGTISGWRQQLDLRDGVISTTATWAAPDGHVTRLSYAVFTDRARPHVAVVRLEMTPQWSGTATVKDTIDGTPATLTSDLTQGRDQARYQDWETITTLGTGLIAGLASQLTVAPAAGSTTDTPVSGTNPQTVAQQLAFPVTAGSSYTVTKYVGIDTGCPGTAGRSWTRPRRSGPAASPGARMADITSTA